MKNSIYILALISISIISYAGPKDKNYKPWKDHKETSTLVTSAQPSELNGPHAKNQKKWEQAETAKVKIVGNERSSLKGPQAKNHKPWN